MKSLIKLPKLQLGDTIGVFTPSFPAHTVFREKYLHGIEELRRVGFKILEGSLTQSQRAQGYRTATGEERANELMELFRNPEVKGIISTIGGSNSASLLEHLDYDAIRANPKIFCGYSDVTSLHMAIHRFAGLTTFYGPAVMPSFGEFPNVLPYTLSSFLRAVGTENKSFIEREILPPEKWSCHIRDIPSGAWKTEPRILHDQTGWVTSATGTIIAPVLVANINTVLSLMGTQYFPDFTGHIVVLEDAEASLSAQERRWTQIRQSRILENARALLVGKPEVLKLEGAPFSLTELIEEVLRDLPIPRVYGFDCGHTSPMLTIAQGIPLRLELDGNRARLFTIEDATS